MTSTFTQEIAARLEAVRAGQGLTIQSIATQTGISARQVKAKFSGKRPITTGDLHKFATALGIKPSTICEGF